MKYYRRQSARPMGIGLALGGIIFTAAAGFFFFHLQGSHQTDPPPNWMVGLIDGLMGYGSIVFPIVFGVFSLVLVVFGLVIAIRGGEHKCSIDGQTLAWEAPFGNGGNVAIKDIQRFIIHSSAFGRGGSETYYVKTQDGELEIDSNALGDHYLFIRALLINNKTVEVELRYEDVGIRKRRLLPSEERRLASWCRRWGSKLNVGYVRG